MGNILSDLMVLMFSIAGFLTLYMIIAGIGELLCRKYPAFKAWVEKED